MSSHLASSRLTSSRLRSSPHVFTSSATSALATPSLDTTQPPLLTTPPLPTFPTTPPLFPLPSPPPLPPSPPLPTSPSILTTLPLPFSPRPHLPPSLPRAPPLQAIASSRPNVHLLKTRRLVQFGGFTSVLPLLDALASLVGRLDFDFALPLSDTDLPLRTNAELTTFLAPFRNRSFLHIHSTPAGPPDDTDEEGRNGRDSGGLSHAALSRYAVIECGGFGFVSVNGSVPRPEGSRACCLGASGPVMSARLPYSPPSPREGERVYSGSPWGVLSAELASYLVHHPEAHRWGR